MELRCSLDLAMWLGAICPDNPDHHRALKKAGHMLVRDIDTSWPMFWPLIASDVPADVGTKSS